MTKSKKRPNDMKKYFHKLPECAWYDMDSARCQHFDLRMSIVSWIICNYTDWVIFLQQCVFRIGRLVIQILLLGSVNIAPQYERLDTCVKIKYAY